MSATQLGIPSDFADFGPRPEVSFYPDVSENLTGYDRTPGVAARRQLIQKRNRDLA